MKKICIGTATLILGDCEEFMKDIPDKSYDLAVVDPPYGIGRDGQKKSTSKNGGRKAYKFKGWDNLTPDKKYFNNIFRVSRNQVIWGANYFTEFLPPSMGWIFWDKGQRICNSDGELAFSSFNKALRVVEYNRCEIKKDGAIHPTQKPIKLYEWVYSNYAKPGQSLIDTHGGSMSSVIAALNMGFEITCIEKDEEYFYAAVERIANATKQMKLF